MAWGPPAAAVRCYLSRGEGTIHGNVRNDSGAAFGQLLLVCQHQCQSSTRVYFSGAYGFAGMWPVHWAWLPSLPLFMVSTSLSAFLPTPLSY